jgi:uncharacterized protein (DUF1501 family)
MLAKACVKCCRHDQGKTQRRTLIYLGREQDGTDTLAKALAGAIRAFLDDLTAARRANRAMVLCFREFGRPLAENCLGGTDDDTAGLVLIAGA